MAAKKNRGLSESAWIAGLVLLLAPAAVAASRGMAADVRILDLLVAAALVVLVAGCSPVLEARTPKAPRWFALLWGLASCACSACALAASPNPARSWLAESLAALTTLVVAAFGFEMLRRQRTHLISSLSVVCSMGLAGWLSGGWAFAPASLSASGHLVLSLLVLAAVAVAIRAAFGTAEQQLLQQCPEVASSVGAGKRALASAALSLAAVGAVPAVLMLLGW